MKPLLPGRLEQPRCRRHGIPGAWPPAASVVRRALQDAQEPVVITGAALGLPGVTPFDDDQHRADPRLASSSSPRCPSTLRQRRWPTCGSPVWSRTPDGSGSFQTIDDEADVIKLAGQRAPLDVVEQFGIDNARDAALDTRPGWRSVPASTPCATRASRWSCATRPRRWARSCPTVGACPSRCATTPASSSPRRSRVPPFAEPSRLHRPTAAAASTCSPWRVLRTQLTGSEPDCAEGRPLIAELKPRSMRRRPFEFDRRFLFRVLSMGHSQFAEIIGARGPNTQVNAACASTTQAVGRGRGLDPLRPLPPGHRHLRRRRHRRQPACRGSAAGFLASGAAATDERVEDAATPFDRRRHGMIVGMGAAAFVVESAEAARERGIQPICEVLGTVIANSAFHGTRLDVDHIGGSWRPSVSEAERVGNRPHAIARQDGVHLARDLHPGPWRQRRGRDQRPARGCFGADADKIVITNTKGFTGHAMGAGIEDVVAIKALETGLVPPVPNYKEPDPDLGVLNLSRAAYPVRVRPASGGRLRLAGRDDAHCAGPRCPTAAAAPPRARLRLPDRRPSRLAAVARLLAGRHGNSLRSTTAGCGSSTPVRPPTPVVPTTACRSRMPADDPPRRGRHRRPGMPVRPLPLRRRPPAASVHLRRGRARCPGCRAPAPAAPRHRSRRPIRPAADRPGAGHSDRDRVRADRLPGRPARPRPRPGSRPRRRHRQAGRSLRRRA
jgi:hypothetical protein